MRSEFCYFFIARAYVCAHPYARHTQIKIENNCLGYSDFSDVPSLYINLPRFAKYTVGDGRYFKKTELQKLRKDIKLADGKKYFTKHYGKLRMESIIKSLLCGLSAGLYTSFAAALALWIIDIGFWWLALVAIVVGTAVSSPIFYFARFRPTALSGARRIDALGLEERLVTMVEYENDESYIAKVQREDAKEKLDAFSPANIKLKISKAIVICLAIAFFVSSGMTTVTVLSEKGIIGSFNEIIDDIVPDEPEVYVAVTYEVEEGGYIEGEADQLVLFGGSSEPVEAIADEGYAFVEWSDGYTKPMRSDSKIEEEVIYFAIFEPVGEGDQPGDQDGGDEGENGKPDEQGSPGENGEPNPDAEDPNSPMGGGKYTTANQIINGETYYRELLEGYQDDIRKFLEEHGDSLTEEERKIIESYIDIV